MFAENFVKTNFEAQRPHKPKEHLPVDQKVKPLVSIGPWLVCQKSVNGQTRNCRPVMNNNETTCAIHLSSHGTFSQNRRCGSFGSHHDGPQKTTGGVRDSGISKAIRSSAQTRLAPQLFPCTPSPSGSRSISARTFYHGRPLDTRNHNCCTYKRKYLSAACSPLRTLRQICKEL